MLLWAEFNYKEEQRQDLLRQAEKQRLIRKVLAKRGRGRRFFGHSLSWLVSLLVR